MKKKVRSHKFERADTTDQPQQRDAFLATFYSYS